MEFKIIIFYRKSALQTAAEEGNIEIVKILLSKNEIDINDKSINTFICLITFKFQFFYQISYFKYFHRISFTISLLHYGVINFMKLKQLLFFIKFHHYMFLKLE